MTQVSHTPPTDGNHGTVEIVIEADAAPAIEAFRRAWWWLFLIQQRKLARDFLNQRVSATYRRLGWEWPP